MARCMNYLLVPFYTYVIDDPAEYGLLSELYSYVALLNILYLYGMETTYFRYASRGRWREEQLFGQLLGLVLGSSLLFSGALYLFSEPLSVVLKYETGGPLLRMMAMILFLDAAVALPFARLRLKQKAWRFASLRLSSVALNIALNIFFLWICPQASSGKWGSLAEQAISPLYVAESSKVSYILLSNILSNLVWIPLFHRQWREMRLDLRQVQRLLYYGLPLMGMGLAGVGIEMLPRVLFRHIGSITEQSLALRELGVYVASAKLAVLMQLGVQAYRYAAEPFMLSNSSSKQHRKQMAEATRWFLWIAAWLFVGISLHAEPIAFLFLRTAAYREALDVLPVLLVAHLCMGLYYNFSIWCKRLGKTYYNLYMSTGGLLLTLSILLAGQWGYSTLAWTLLITYASMAIFCYFWGQKQYPIPYQLKGGLLYLGLGILVIASPQLIGAWTSQAGLPTVAFLAYTLLFWIMNKKSCKNLLLSRS